MRLSIKTKQVLGVTSTVGIVVVALSVYHLSTLARVSLEESKARAQLLSSAIYQRARAVVRQTSDPYAALRADPGLNDILQASIYSPDVTDAAVVAPDGIIVAHLDPSRIGMPIPDRPPIDELLRLNGVQQLWTIFRDPGRTVELRLALAEETGREFGTIRIGISTLLVRNMLEDGLRDPLQIVLAALLVATAVAMLLAQLLLRPIHVLRSGLSRLQQGETGVTLDLPKDEFGDLGTFFNAVSAKMSAERSELAGQKANLESIVERLEDAVAIFNANGEILFANPAMNELLPAGDGGAAEEPWREMVNRTIAARQSYGPVSVHLPDRGRPSEEGTPRPEWLLLTHPIHDVDQRLIGVMLVARNLEYLSQVQSMVKYSRKLTALGRLSAGVAHEVKNPLNAMMIHLELLRQKLGRPALVGAGTDPGRPPRSIAPPAFDAGAALDHVAIIANEIKRLDQVLQGFLKFTRPEDLRLQPVHVPSLLQEVADVIEAEARKSGIKLVVECPPHVPEINGDPGMLRQALLNLALNACQAMPGGGELRFRCRGGANRRVELVVEDTGTGIPPEHLPKIFDLYFTTREKGSGIGLSMVYRTVQLHDGDVEVQSTPGQGSAFKLLLPAA
ncbi:MAG TPA: ATP-binding protein [Vicinamibacterales bacterium]|nr:ATP-binding protein [Vicinamibacterales bacterium]